MADITSYRLPDGELHRIYASQIEPAELPRRSPSAADRDALRPLALLTVGQTGAGKSFLSESLLPALRQRRAGRPFQVAHLIADTFKTYHPSFSRLMVTNPRLASAATGHDARRWLMMAAREVVARRIDVLLESACRHPGDFPELAQVFRDAGFRIEVLVLAVPAPLSRLGILVRFYERLPGAQSRGLPVRLTPVKVHDDSYAGLVDAAAFLDDSSVADQVLVVRRGNWVAYGEDRGVNKQVYQAVGVVKALQRERERPLTTEETETALKDLNKLTLDEDAAKQVDEVRDMLRPLMSGENAQDQRWPELVPLEFASRAEDSQGFNVLHLGVH
ncbi:hypothetical protein HIM_07791 [Hirsutella minnesotensis 3608]|uniref:Zeta toxin domain-containing protein n=1 Tax=Hirsutella minnesotensis 3608 TaxID=1043627 RepID=A0A0F7ZYP8_9HYPO|nr:hypothetical protein HIM_07791 [Hirsutella minnesotensis 3608]